MAREGVLEAQAAGKLLKAHGFAFDVVYTRCLISILFRVYPRLYLIELVHVYF